jgi:glycerol kinase
MAFQTRDVVDAMGADIGGPLKELRVDGGASVMDFLCQFQADLLGIPVRRPKTTETTAAGAAFMAGQGAGYWSPEEALQDLWQQDREFLPRISRDQADDLQEGWRRALARSRGWMNPA